jgi:hypothetical protein
MTTTAIKTARELRASLSTGAVCLVGFRKLNGEVTERYITRNQDYIPEDARPQYVKAENPHYITAWDVEKKGWISFHESQVLAWEEHQ